jgi:hypothetical protein
MPKVKLHPWIKEISGKMGDIVFKRLPNGETIMTQSPDMTNVEWSEAQQAHRVRFAQAVQNTKAALADPALRAKYEKIAKKQRKRTWDVALSDNMDMLRPNQ